MTKNENLKKLIESMENCIDSIKSGNKLNEEQYKIVVCKALRNMALMLIDLNNKLEKPKDENETIQNLKNIFGMRD